MLKKDITAMCRYKHRPYHLKKGWVGNGFPRGGQCFTFTRNKYRIIVLFFVVFFFGRGIFFSNCTKIIRFFISYIIFNNIRRQKTKNKTECNHNQQHPHPALKNVNVPREMHKDTKCSVNNNL